MHLSAPPPATASAPRGWDDLADADAFYPPDLPEDWRLTYFANAFGAVALPWHAWREVPDATLAVWHAEVGPGFRIFLAQPEADARQNTARAALGGTLGGWVRAGADDDLSGAGVYELLTPAGDLCGLAAVAPTAILAAPRAARDWLRSLPARPGLVILPRPTSGMLGDWFTLLTLSGWR